MSARLRWLDVFTAVPLGGNPLAVVWGAERWSAGAMQGVAKELGLSETVFVLPAEAGGDARLRIFTPARELPMAGHPVVGAAWALHDEGAIGAEASLETGAGPLAVRADARGAAMVQARPVRGPEVDAREAAAACGCPAAPGARAWVWSTGLPQLMLPVAGDAELSAAQPDHPALVALGERDGWFNVSAYVVRERSEGRVAVRVRNFAPRVGVPEDPFTGSAAGALGARLAADAGVDGELTVEVAQGEELGRPGAGTVRVSARAGVPHRVEVGGRVVSVLEGRLQFNPGAERRKPADRDR
jgi:trans-2,3-dihydro-3-hydroxyanthranilate isomerase